MQPQIKFLPRDLGGELAQRRIGNLILRIKPRPRRHMAREPAFEVGDAIAGARRQHEGPRKSGALVERLRQSEQLRLLDQIDLVEHQHLGGTDIGKAAQDRVLVVLHALPRIDQKRDDVGVVRAAPGAADHGAVEPAARRENTRRIDENELA